jgi:hypothetical protein
MPPSVDLAREWAPTEGDVVNHTEGVFDEVGHPHVRRVQPSPGWVSASQHRNSLTVNASLRRAVSARRATTSRGQLLSRKAPVYEELEQSRSAAGHRAADAGGPDPRSVAPTAPSRVPSDHALITAATRPSDLGASLKSPSQKLPGVFTNNATAALPQGGAMSDARWNDPREHAGRDPDDQWPRVHDPRDRDEHDPRDGLLRDLDLPRGDESGLVVDRVGFTSSTAKTAARWPPSVRSASCWNTISIFRTTPWRTCTIRGSSSLLT